MVNFNDTLILVDKMSKLIHRVELIKKRKEKIDKLLKDEKGLDKIN